uniref:Uncharacterized protein n=1 Tax=Rhizophora mucronata TaxID=61149 RepID=A0A2P2LYB6_RHIMU
MDVIHTLTEDTVTMKLPARTIEGTRQSDNSPTRWTAFSCSTFPGPRQHQYGKSPVQESSLRENKESSPLEVTVLKHVAYRTTKS